ncbi:hypothetical protein B0H17DRAFT_1130621 [Mycena rosella]|uniref:Uncharacterized protein n=1 Tax=Mycena rosella TaxID=1033263 RepID=A0AAD7DQ04_MYCRO|nr:hypothetical protein B0H17DRAFT_1130621 [Mycena rosella]
MQRLRLTFATSTSNFPDLPTCAALPHRPAPYHRHAPPGLRIILLVTAELDKVKAFLLQITVIVLDVWKSIAVQATFITCRSRQTLPPTNEGVVGLLPTYPEGTEVDCVDLKFGKADFVACTFTFPVSSVADLVHLITRSPLPALAICFYGYHFLPSPVEPVRALDYTYATMANEPFEALLFGRRWNPEGHSLTLDCPLDVHEDVGMLFMLQLGQVRQIEAPTNTLVWRAVGGMSVDVHLNYGEEYCNFHEIVAGTLQTRMPMTTAEWNLEPGQWIIAQITLRRRQTTLPAVKSFHIVASELRVADIAV